MLLDTTTRTLELILGTAQTTTAMSIVVDYVETTSTTHLAAQSNSASNGTTAVTILAAPAASTQRKVNSLSVYNADSVAKIVTVRLNDNATLRPFVVVTLQVGETLGYSDTGGWYVLTSAGTRKEGTVTAIEIVNVPAGNIAATNVQAALNELDTEKALLAGSASQTFSVAPATADTHAATRAQALQMLEVSTALATIADGVTTYLGCAGASTTELNVWMRIPFACVVRNISTQTSTTTAGTRTYTVMKNGVATAATCAASAGSTQSAYTGDSVTFAVADVISLRLVTSGGSDTVAHNAIITLSRT